MIRNRVKQCRKAAGLTLAELAEITGVGVSTICQIEQGAEPRVVTAIRLARALGKRVEWLWLV